MRHPSSFPRFLRGLASSTLVLVCAFLTTACGAVNDLVQVQVNPSTAAVYVDGESKGEGSKPVRFNFEETRRVILQVVHEGYRPFYAYYEAEQIERLVDEEREITVTLRSY